MAILDLIIDVLKIVGYVLAGCLVLIVLVALVAVLVDALASLVSRWRQRWPSAWQLALLVRLDEANGRFHPAVQVRGRGRSEQARIRLELIDGEGRVRLTRARSFPLRAFNGELALPTFGPPGGARPAEALGWHWDVAIEDEKGERVRWREHPRPACRLNAEAELEGEAVRVRSGSAGGDGSSHAGDDSIHFELGCFTHMSSEPGPAPTYGTVETPNYLRRPASVGRPTEGTGQSAVICASCGEWVNLKVRSQGAVLRRRAARVVLAVALAAYIAAVYSGPTGEIGAGRALLLLIAFPAIFVSLGSLFSAFFASQVDLGLEIADDPGNHRLFSLGSS